MKARQSVPVHTTIAHFLVLHISILTNVLLMIVVGLLFWQHSLQLKEMNALLQTQLALTRQIVSDTAYTKNQLLTTRNFIDQCNTTAYSDEKLNPPIEKKENAVENSEIIPAQ